MTISQFLDFMGEDDGFDSPLMPSRAYPDGKSYHISSPDAETGLRLNALAEITLKMNKGVEVSEFDVQRLRMDDRQEQEFAGEVLGNDVLDQMLADGCKWEHIRRLTQYAFTYFGVSPEAAENAAKQGLFSGKAPRQNRQQRRSGEAKSARQGSGGSKKAPKKSR